jgi:ribosomal protein S6
LESLNDVRLVQIQSLERLKNLDVQHSSLMQLSIKSLENDIKKLNEEKERYHVIAFEAVKQVEAEIERTVKIIEGK